MYEKILERYRKGYVTDEQLEEYTRLGAITEEQRQTILNDGVALTLEEAKAMKQEANKKALHDWLDTHPLTWTDGNVYGVTEEDQNEMSINLQQYTVQKQSGRDVTLEWHTQKKQCHAMTEEDYNSLMLEVIDYVYPYRRYQEKVKEQIYNAGSMEDLEAVVIDYGSVG